MTAVLLVDDDRSKLIRLRSALVDLGVNDDDIVDVMDAASARQQLQRRHYDLLLLDVLLPARRDSLPTAEVSIDLLRQIVEDHSLPSPRHIVGVTVDRAVLSDYEDEFRELTTVVLEVGPYGEKWRGALKIVTERCMRSPSGGYEVDVCVVTALRNPEYSAVIDAWPIDWSDEAQFFRGAVSRVGRGEMSNRKIKVVCTHASGVGLVAATDLTTKLIREFHPRVVVMTGFCGGVGVAIGDLVVAEKAWDWQMGKHVPGAFLSGVDQKEGSPELIALSRGLEGDLGELVEESVAIELPAPITLHVAPMVSGSAVVSDSSLHGVLKAQHRKVAAVDMEAYGVYFAAQMAEAPVPKVICVKGVADLADVDKADNAQAFCSSLSARFAWKLLEKVFSE